MKRMIQTLSILLFGCSLAMATPTFTAKPTMKKAGDKYTITFAVSTNTDVEVAILSGTNVVRHLAAGVLGGINAPPEPLKPGLAQELIWDGKDDFGKPVSLNPEPRTLNPLSVRVRLGMGAKLGRFIGEDPYNFGGINAIQACDDGNLYVSGYYGSAYQWETCIRVFSPEGKFLRTVLPFPADLPPGAMKDVARWDEAAKAWHPRNLSILNPEFYSMANAFSDYTMLRASKQGGILLLGSCWVYRVGLDGSIPGDSFATGQRAWPLIAPTEHWDSQLNHYGHPYYHNPGPVIYTASPDGKYLYLTGPFQNLAEKPKQLSDKFPLFGGVFRMKLDGKDTMQLFATIPATADGPWSKEGARLYGNNGFGPVHGLAIDLKGNVYVTDREKNRVVVFSEDGKEIGEISVKNPDKVAVHPKTGAIYVIRRFCNGWGSHSMILDRFDSFAKGATAAASFAKFDKYNSPQMVIIADGDKTRLRFTGAATEDTHIAHGDSPKGFLVLEDCGTEFKPVPPKYEAKPGVQADFARIAADPLREEIYVSDGVNLIYRYDGNTGEGGLLAKDGKPFYAPDLSVSPYDGLLYVRSGESYSGPLQRLTRELAPVPFSGIGENRLADIYGRMGIGYCEKGTGIGPDGKVYECWMYEFSKYFVSGWNPDGTPMKGRYLADKIKESKSIQTDSKVPAERRVASGIIGPVISETGGIRVDLKGNIYLGLGMMPKGYVPPAGFEKAPDYIGMNGSVVKFGPQGGAVLGIDDSKSAGEGIPTMETMDARYKIEGALAMYPGIAPFSGYRYGMNGSSCACRVARFDLDLYGRLALPNVVSTSVRIVDNAGNQICEIGKYGNFDSQYVPADSKDGKPIVATPEIPLAWPTGVGLTEKAAYICDTYNRRVVRVDFTWQAEETVVVK